VTPAQLGGLRREVRRTPSRTSRPTSACANEAVSSRGHTAGHNPLLSSSICLRPNGLGYLADSVVACLGKPQGFTVTTSDGVKVSRSCGPDRRRSPALPDQIIGHSVQICAEFCADYEHCHADRIPQPCFGHAGSCGTRRNSCRAAPRPTHCRSLTGYRKRGGSFVEKTRPASGGKGCRAIPGDPRRAGR